MPDDGVRKTAKKDCHERALGLLAVRQRSRRELERRLLQAGFDADEVAGVLERLERVGLIDDEALARSVVEHGFAIRKESQRVVAGRLRAAGVAPETTSVVLAEAGDDDEQERADALAASRALRLASLPRDKALPRLASFLARRGYAPDVARQAARKALAAESIEED